MAAYSYIDVWKEDILRSLLPYLIVRVTIVCAQVRLVPAISHFRFPGVNASLRLKFELFLTEPLLHLIVLV